MMKLSDATTVADLRAAVLADPGALGDIARRAIVDAAADPAVTAAVASGDHDAARELRRPIVADALAADRELAEALNLRSIAAKRKVGATEARSILLRSGEWGNLVLLSRRAATGDETDLLTVAAINAVETMQPPTVLIDTDEEPVLAMVAAALSALVAAGVIADSTRSALLALTDVTISPWEQVYGVGTQADARAVSVLMRGGA